MDRIEDKCVWRFWYRNIIDSTADKEREQLGDRRNDGESNCNSGDGTGQMAQPCIFVMVNITESKSSINPYPANVDYRVSS
jgi:hypothetical protein